MSRQLDRRAAIKIVALMDRIEELATEAERVAELGLEVASERLCKECGKPTERENGYRYCEGCAEKITKGER